MSITEVRDLIYRLFGIISGCDVSIDYEKESIGIKGNCKTARDERRHAANMEAFYRLAAVDGDASSVSVRDVAGLANPKVLAELIERDVAYTVILQKGSLEYGKTEVPPDSGHGREIGIPPLFYRRILFYIQHGLKALGYFEGKPDGVYGEETRKAVAAFQSDVGIEGGDEGRLLGPMTASVLVARLTNTKGEIVATLKEASKKVPRGGQYFNHLDPTVREAIERACVWLGWTGYPKIDAYAAIAGRFKREHGVFPSLIGPAIMGWLVQRVSSAR